MHLVGLIIKKFVTMRGHMNVKNLDTCFVLLNLFWRFAFLRDICINR